MIAALQGIFRLGLRMESGLPDGMRLPLKSIRQSLAFRLAALTRPKDDLIREATYAVPGLETFFGYYDRTPEGRGGAVLAHAVPRRGSDGAAQICLFEDGEYRKLGETTLWSWQLGARLGWLSQGEDMPEAIIFNAQNGDGPGAVICDAKGQELIRLKDCIYDHSPDGVFGLCIDMARLGWARPGYGYAALPDLGRDQRVPDAGVWRVDLASGARTDLVSMRDIIAVSPKPEFAGAYHYLNHVSVSPDGQRYLVYHLWLSDPGKPDAFSARVLVGDCGGGGLQLVEDQGRPSHYTWLGRDDLVIFRIDGQRSRYRRYDLSIRRNEPFWGFLPAHDGHQSFHPEDQSIFLMDTYPDWLKGEQNIFVYHSDGRRLTARLRADPRLEGLERCDLHPRWSRDGGSVYVDTTHDGIRKLARLRSRGISP